jgi:predicted aspartyl protease
MRSATPFDLVNELMFVNAVVIGPAGWIRARLIVDTGAVLTTLTPSVVEAIGYTEQDRITRTTIRTAAAVEHGYMLRVQEFTSLGFRMRNARIDVADIGHDVDGLLGMSFLQNFILEIRPSERRILVERIGA